MNIAVFGASGVIGRVLLPNLIDAGHRVIAMQHSSPVRTEGVETVPGSMTDADAVERTIDQADVVIQMTKGGQGAEQVVGTSVHGTVNILDAIQRVGGITQYLLTSSDAAVGIWSHPFDAPITHLTKPMSYGGYYSLGKVLEETILAEYDRNGGIPYTIARLSYVHQEDSALDLFLAGANPRHPGRGPFDDQYPPELKSRLEAGEQFIVLPLDGSGHPLKRTLVQRKDVTDALEAMIGRPEAIGETFHLSGPAFSYADACEYLAGKADLPVCEVTLAGAHSFEIDYSHTTDLLDWSPQFDVYAMLDAALEWRQANQQ